MRIEGSAAIVVGGASGLGEATARALHERGAVVTVADVNAEKGEALAGELGDGTRFVACDVREEEQVRTAVRAAVEASGEGGLRISICCAGVGWPEKIASSRGPHQLQSFETVLAINLIGTFNALRYAAHAMLAAEPLESGERGVCVNTASTAAFDGQIGQVAYSAAKGAIVGMTLPASRDLADKGVRVMTIAPGTFDTPLLALLPDEKKDALAAEIPFPRRLGRPDEFAALALHIVENQVLNGETIRLDGAMRMPPR
jgi:3-hydroxyacyl-CoA dehydrogenase / 3-hydroxy-2-methylbutyryl-CoA dehydrogenase